MEHISSSLDNILTILQTKAKQKGNPIESILPTIQSTINEVKNELLKTVFNSLQHGNKSEATKEVSDKPRSQLYSQILIKSGEAKKDPKIKNEFLRKIDNTLMEKNIDASIVGASSTAKGDVIIKLKETDNINSIINELIKENEPAFQEKMSHITPSMPKVSITNIPDYYDLTDLSEVRKSLLSSNKELSEIITQQNLKFELLFKYNTKRSTQTIIAKCSQEIRSFLNKNGNEIKLGCILCKTFDHVHLKICSKCCKIGHLKKDCHSNMTKCTFCYNNHSFKDCPVKNDTCQHKCGNCINKGMPDNINHNCFSFKCPLVKKAKEFILKRSHNFIVQQDQL